MSRWTRREPVDDDDDEDYDLMRRGAKLSSGPKYVPPPRIDDKDTYETSSLAMSLSGWGDGLPRPLTKRGSSRRKTARGGKTRSCGTSKTSARSTPKKSGIQKGGKRKSAKGSSCNCSG
jgi:hypothetical protein